MTYLQIALGFTEFLCAGAAYWQLRGRRDPLFVPFAAVVAAAGVAVPLLFPLGHPTWFSLSLQALAVTALLLIAATAHRRPDVRV
ncbi:hypothetical protein ACKI1I_39465 [Streptomyces turgidiscabies]|uniref:Uncharacterized protein n=1 Tax=Streptomyces turgidiscabies (strain Car8) TaxID=698760 RepID=L7F4L0_STRT8|nr:MULTISPECIES: hypothetical protein [Streptomyces]ELP65555.1 hypothetical protein STRTUCAR8_04150 [Streptomyces turgidiscabies Car8]MDX3497593.1 hypothetical protein [Streptomyces turgidiscabies]GAQ76115.1 hypothetical protein T45_07904 [Streptomyces turgidiscabies]